MFDKTKLQVILENYKKILSDSRWKNECYKWQAVKCFQDNWDIDAADFKNMFKKSVAKSDNLLSSMNYFPARMIEVFSDVAQEDVRNMFKDLYDESKSVISRIEDFQNEAERIRSTYGNEKWQSHYQNANSISTYLWLRYPDKYYIYKFSDVKKAAEEINSDFRPQKGAAADSMNDFIKCYDEIADFAKGDTELMSIIESCIDDTCYPDPYCKTLAIDIGFYISRCYKKDDNISSNQQLDNGISFSKDKWLKILNNKNIVGPVYGKMLAMFYTEPDGVTVLDLAQKFGVNPMSVNGTVTNFIKCMQRETDCNLSDDPVGKYWPIVFLYENISGGKRLWKLRPELYEALTEFDILKYLPEEIDMTKIAKGGLNKIYYGAPGCGKSHYVSSLIKSAGVLPENIIRVTFHPEYANSDFAGQILPTIEDNGDSEIVKYIFNPGPFTIALKTAYNTTDMVYLIIEEINRGNAAAIFGDLFQLLDRVKDTDSEDFSASEYPICNINMQKYLYNNVRTEAIKDKIKTGIFIPSNLTIFATMNSSDQNVFTLDTAFKRRWNFEQISNNIIKDSNHSYKNWYIPGTDITWAIFLTKLNNRILDNEITNEDKRLGKYFVSKECLSENFDMDYAVADKKKQFAYKVLEYIWNDVCKIGREEWFDTDKYKTLEDLIDAFVSLDDPLKVFNINFRE